MHRTHTIGNPIANTVGLLLVCLLLAALPRNTGSAQSAGRYQDAPAIDGLWQGQTGQRERVLLSVDNAAIQTIIVSVTIEGERDDKPCRDTLLYVKTAPTNVGLAPVIDNRFALTIEEAEMTFKMIGSFDPGNSASGNVQLTTHPERPFACSGSGSTTWHAVPQERAGQPTAAPTPQSPPGAQPRPAPNPRATAQPQPSTPPQPSAPQPDATQPPAEREPPPATTQPAASTSAPTGTSTPSRDSQPQPDVPPSTATATPMPSSTPQSSSSSALCEDAPDPAVATDDPIQIIEINKKAEIVTLENIGSSSVDLSDWTLCSLTGAQQHEGFAGVTIEAGETRSLLHIGNPIWLNDAADDGVLYDPEGNLISYWADPAS